MDGDGDAPSEPAGPRPIRKLAADVVNRIAAAEVRNRTHRAD